MTTAYLPDLCEGERQKLVKRLMADKNQKTTASAKLGPESSKNLQSVLQLLTNEGDFDKFAALKVAVDDDARTDLVMKREGHSKEKASELTPALIKGLRPKAAGCYLNWQPAASQFAGYYQKPLDAKKDSQKKGGKTKARKQMHSTARMYGGKWSQGQALNLVVSQLWAWHRKYGGVSCLSRWKGR